MKAIVIIAIVVLVVFMLGLILAPFLRKNQAGDPGISSKGGPFSGR